MSKYRHYKNIGKIELLEQFIISCFQSIIIIHEDRSSIIETLQRSHLLTSPLSAYAI